MEIEKKSLEVLVLLPQIFYACSQCDDKVMAMYWKHESQYFCKSFSEDLETAAELYEMGKLGIKWDELI